MENEDKLTGWSRALIGARWMKGSFANWFANSFVMFMTFVVILIAIGLGMYFDGAYAQRWAPTPGDKTWFMLYGWIVSLGMIFLMSAGIKAVQDGARRAGGIMIAAGVYFLILSLTQSVGYVTLKAEEMTQAAKQFDASKDQGTSLIDELKSQRAALEARIEGRSSTLSSEINQYITDGEANDERANGNQARRSELENRLDSELVEINNRILCLSGDATKCLEGEAGQNGDAALIPPSRHDPGVKVWAYVLTLGKADDNFRDGFTVYYLMFWSIGCPLLGLMLSCYLVVTRHTRTLSEQTAEPDATQDTPENEAVGTDALLNEILGTSDIDWLKKAVSHRRNFDDGIRDKTKLKITDKAWVRETRDRLRKYRREGLNLEDVASMMGYAVSELEAILPQIMDEAEVQAFMEMGADERSATTNNLEGLPGIAAE